MLSYMLPVEDKPPPSKTHLQLELEMLQEQAVGLMRLDAAPLTNGVKETAPLLTNGIKKPARRPPAPTISTESSVSSLSSKASDGTTPTDKLKPRLAQNGASKATSLKRVSFGSSKGSMVETLIFESPLQEEPEIATPTTEPTSSFPTDGDNSGNDSKNPSTRVRVTFFECSRPQIVHSPEPGHVCLDVLDAPIMTTVSPSSQLQYNRQASTDSGWENPFRPDGDLSREADEIVERIREGKPIAGNGTIATPTDSVDVGSFKVAPVAAVPSAAGNGAAKPPSAATPGQVTVQRVVLPPGAAAEPEHVVLKKKPKCRCCVIQ